MNKKFMKAGFPTTTMLLLIISLSVTTFAYLTVKHLATIPTSGVIGEPELTATPSTIEWGTMKHNISCTRTITLENTGNVTITNLQMNYTLPVAFTGSLTWDGAGGSIDVDKTLLVNFTLTISTGPKDTPFSFDINIYGE